MRLLIPWAQRLFPYYIQPPNHAWHATTDAQHMFVEGLQYSKSILQRPRKVQGWIVIRYSCKWQKNQVTLKWFVFLSCERRQSTTGIRHPAPILLLLRTEQVVSFLKFSLKSKMATRAPDIRSVIRTQRRRKRGRAKRLPSWVNWRAFPGSPIQSAPSVYISGHPSWDEGQKHRNIVLWPTHCHPE